MGKRRRRTPARLGEKLSKIRASLGLSQTELWKKLEIDEYLPYTVISGYERGLREPSLEIILKYSKLAEVPMEVLADDDLDLPEHIPAKAGYQWILKRVKARRVQK